MSEQENKRLKDLEEKVDKILAALVGNDISKNGGLVEDIRDLKRSTIPGIITRLEKLEAIKNKAIWMAVGAGMTGGISLVKIVQWISEAAKQ